MATKRDKKIVNRLEMPDMSREEWEKFYDENKYFFTGEGREFYLKNDKYFEDNSFTERMPSCRRIYAVTDWGSYITVQPGEWSKSAFLLCSPSDVSPLRERLKEKGCRRLTFKLKGCVKEGYFGIIKNLDGTEGAGIVIPPPKEDEHVAYYYSSYYSTRYEQACRECGSLPYLVENNRFVERLPDEILYLLDLKEFDIKSVKQNIENIAYLKPEYFGEHEEEIIKIAKKAVEKFYSQNKEDKDIEQKVSEKLKRTDELISAKRAEYEKIKAKQESIAKKEAEKNERIKKMIDGLGAKKDDKSR